MSESNGVFRKAQRHLAKRDFSVTTRRIRRHFLDEYLEHVQRAADTVGISAGELMEPARAAALRRDRATRGARVGRQVIEKGDC